MSKDKLRFITYLSPGVPVQIFETVMHYLEEVTGKQTYLIHESRWSGPPSDREDPFTADDVDVGFVCCASVLKLLQEKKHLELCEAAPIYSHPKGEHQPIYFSELILNKENSKTTKLKDFNDLKGHSFVYNEPLSLSGALVVLGELKKRGYNSSFFGNILQSGSHRNSIKMVLDGKADTAAIDSTALKYYLLEHPEYEDKIRILTSLGPMPIQPVVFNSRLSDELKKQISEALLDLHNKPEWMSKLKEYSLEKFAPIDMSFYDMEVKLMESVKNLKLSSAYY